MTVNQAKSVNAKASTGEVTVSGKNIKFRTLAAKGQSLAV